jgi:hypothetical protein
LWFVVSAFLGVYAASFFGCKPTFWDGPSVPSTTTKKWRCTNTQKSQHNQRYIWFLISFRSSHCSIVPCSCPMVATSILLCTQCCIQTDQANCMFPIWKANNEQATTEFCSFAGTTFWDPLFTVWLHIGHCKFKQCFVSVTLQQNKVSLSLSMPCRPYCLHQGIPPPFLTAALYLGKYSASHPSHSTGGWVDTRASLHVSEKRMPLSLTVVKTPDYLAHSLVTRQTQL